MTITISLTDSGPLKREIVERAYGLCGQSESEFGISDEEWQTGLRRLNSVARQLVAEGVAIAFNFPSYGVGEPEEYSGITFDQLEGLASRLAIAIAPDLGHVFTPAAMAGINMSIRHLRSSTATIPTMPRSADTVRGAGTRRLGISPFINETADSVNQDDA